MPDDLPITLEDNELDVETQFGSTSAPSAAALEGLHAFHGSPEQIGADLFIRFCMPALKAFAAADPTAPAQAYSGFLSAAFGSMCADFGKPLALDLVDATRDSLARWEPEQRSRLQ